MVYIYRTQYFSTIKKKEILTFGTAWMDFEGPVLSEKKSDRERQILYYLTQTWNPKIQNKQKKAKRKLQDTEISAYQRRGLVWAQWVKANCMVMDGNLTCGGDSSEYRCHTVVLCTQTYII